MAEIAAYYNRLPGVKPVKKFESRDVAITRIWAVLSPDKPKVARKTKAARKKATSGRKQQGSHVWFPWTLCGWGFLE